MIFKLIVIVTLAVTVTCSPANQKPAVCQSEECKRFARIITSHIDESKDPCKDWYLYACGKFAQVHPLPNGTNSIDALILVDEGNQVRTETALDNPNLKTHGSKIVRKMKQVYDDCLKESSEDFLIKLRRKNNEYLLELRKKMIKEVFQEGKDAPFVPRKIPTVEEIMKRKMDKKRECRRIVTIKWEFAFVRAWLDRFMDKNATAEARKVINNVYSAMLNKINLDWATPAEKKTYREQLSKLKKSLVYPEWIGDDKELDSEYKNDTVSTIHELVNDFAEHPKWPCLAANAQFFPSNEIRIPAGILQNLLFNHKVVAALNYGGGGFISGHEMSHALNHYLINSTGKAVPLDCISKQLTSVREPQTGLKYLDAQYIISDAYADVGAINASLIALRDAAKEDIRLPSPASKFTPEQLFFLSTANSWCHHSTDSFVKNLLSNPYGSPFNYHRVVIPVMNSPDFAKAFNCKAGTPMNPVDKCRLW